MISRGTEPLVDPPIISIVIPMYQESRRIDTTLRDVIATLDIWRLPCEVLAVDDGSTDGTSGVVASITDELSGTGSAAASSVRVLRHDGNRGKGAAVRTGLAASRGKWVLTMDADNSARLAELYKLSSASGRSGAALVAGSRVARGADVCANPRRVAAGFVFRTALALLGMGFIRDTKCGFKLYRADAAALCAAESREDGFAFDLEHLGLCERCGLGVREVGIKWEHRDGGTISVVREGFRMLTQAWRIRRRLSRLPHRTGAPVPAPDMILELKPIAGTQIESTTNERADAYEGAPL